MTQPVYLICGVPGSGKTWVCKQLEHKFKYVPHDEHYTDFIKILEKATHESGKPIITECPFAERLIRGELEKAGVKVIPYFVIESPMVAQKRYIEREKKSYPKMFYTRATSIKKRAQEWFAPQGTSEEVLGMLKGV